MSISLINEAFKTSLPTTLKFVLLAICDNASDEGECFLLNETIARKTSLTGRAVRKSIEQLKSLGFLSVTYRTGRSNVYKVTMNLTPEQYSGTPERGSSTPEQGSAPPERGSSITLTKPYSNHHLTKLEEKSNDFPDDQLNQDQQQKQKRKPAQKKAAVIVQPPEWMPAPEWLDFIAMRQAIKKPMTEQAQHRMINKLEAFLRKGIDIAAALDASIRNNWSDVYEPRVERKTKHEETKEWLAQITGKTNKKEERYVIDI